MKISEDTSLEDMLRIFSETWGTDNPRDMYGWIYREGRSYTPAPRPAGIKRGIPKWCFDNAIEVYNLHGLQYVEGFAISANITGMPIHHAWNVTDDGTVVDVTWHPVGLEYYGIAVDLEDENYDRDSWTTPLGVLVG